LQIFQESVPIPLVIILRAHFYTPLTGVCALCEADSPDTMNVWAVLRHYVPYKELRTLRRLRVYPSALCSGNSLLAQTIPTAKSENPIP
jgi:hypothetical protein